MEDDLWARQWKYDPFYYSSVKEITRANDEDLQYFTSECERCGSKESEVWFIENRITNGMSGDYHVCCKACCDLLGGESVPTLRAVDGCAECGHGVGAHEMYCSRWLAS